MQGRWRTRVEAKPTKCGSYKRTSQMKRSALFAVLFLPSDVALAEDPAECFPNLIKHNMSEEARQIQKSVAPALPTDISAYVTLSSVTAIGPRLVFGTIWKLNHADLMQNLQAKQSTLSGLRTEMDQHTQAYVCSDKLLSAFVKLGGRVQYTYKTQDGFAVASPSVSVCPD